MTTDDLTGTYRDQNGDTRRVMGRSDGTDIWRTTGPVAGFIDVTGGHIRRSWSRVPDAAPAAARRVRPGPAVRRAGW